MMVALNLKEFGLTSFKGHYTDFEAGWYKQVGGQLFTTMTIFAIQPGIDFIVEILSFKAAARMRGKENEHEDFFHTDYLTFIENFAGPEYLFFFKAATTNLTMMICFILGGLMPSYYIIGMVAIAT